MGTGPGDPVADADGGGTGGGAGAAVVGGVVGGGMTPGPIGGCWLNGVGDTPGIGVPFPGPVGAGAGEALSSTWATCLLRYMLRRLACFSSDLISGRRSLTFESVEHE